MVTDANQWFGSEPTLLGQNQLFGSGVLLGKRELLSEVPKRVGSAPKELVLPQESLRLLGQNQPFWGRTNPSPARPPRALGPGAHELEAYGVSSIRGF